MRLQTLALALAVIVGLLGGLHLALTPLAYAEWTIEALWFVGTGLAIVVAGTANFVGFRSWGLGGQRILTAINIAMGCYFAAAWLVLPGPQIIFGVMLFAGLATCSLIAARSKGISNPS
ncbi:hypothetical protein [Aurantiacibacter gangjinensis]|uniref:Uncharacterized protein n=1 Tax=Aurantiacibacter gangjinensis TaxID=502682 RepID=A0A0G9MP57_9SPHN|nr:hypothetical protein [Aurantiacibacter gangjinensis]KLE32502.1 hypothetical protein AAW01_00005 [Aurantiacibacter gangjinensis]